MALALHPPPLASLAEALMHPGAYPHPVARVERIETHISWVFLAGDFAYKVKKPVRLPFLDFTTLAARERFCREELRLNKRTAPDLYLDVVPVGGSPPRIGSGAEPADWAVRMRRFPQGALLDIQATDGLLESWHVDALADAVGKLHERAARAAPDAPFGSAAMVADPALGNFTEIQALLPPGTAAPAHFAALREWTRAAIGALEPRFGERKAQGFVRECHGDLHLGNAFLEHGMVRLFDCIEFDPALRWTDVMNDVAFACMDLMYHGLPRQAFRFLDRYLERTGDYAGLQLLRFYMVYRAMVRAKVACVRMAQAGAGSGALDARRIFESYLALAARLACREAPVLVVMHGVSASGKTVASQRLLEALGAVRLRSDVERKRLHGLPAGARAIAAPGEGLYVPSHTEATYARLESLAREVLSAGYAVVVDASFLERARRDRFLLVAKEHGAAFEIACCRAPEEVLRGRIELRMRKGEDASDATIPVLERQLASVEALGGDEHAHAILLDTTSTSQWHGAVESFARRLRMSMGAP